MIKKLTDVCDIQYGYAFNSAGFTSDAAYIPLIRIRDVKRGYSETYFSMDYPKEYIVHNSDLLISMDGEFNIARWKGQDALLNQRVCKVTAKQDVNEEYLRFALTRILKRLEDKTSFVTVKHLSARELNKLELVIPAIEEQNRTALLLSTLEALQSLKHEELSKLDELVNARFSELFGDPVANDKNWPVVTISDIAEVKIGPFGTLLHKEDYIEGGHALVNPSQIKDGKIVIDSHLTISDEKYHELSAYHLQIGDIVFGRRGEMGRCAVVKESGLLCGTGSLIVRPSSKIKPYFLQNILSSPGYKKIIEEKAVGITMLNVNVPIVSALNIPLLPINLQNQFIQFMSQVVKSKSAIPKSLDETQTLFNSLMQEYFG